MRVIFGFFAAWLLVSGLVGCSPKPSGSIPVADFFSYTEKTNFKISPNGRYVSYVQADENQRKQIFLLDMEQKEPHAALVRDSMPNVQNYYWASDKDLIFTAREEGENRSQAYIIDLSTKDIHVLIPRSQTRFRFVSPLVDSRNKVLVAMNERDSTAFDIYRLDVGSGEREMIARNPGNIIRWYADLDGQLRLALASDSVVETMLYRASEQEEFRPVTRNSFRTTVNPLGFAKGKKNHVYALSNADRDKMSLVEINAETGQETNVLFSHAESDVSPGGYSEQTGSISYAYYFTWKRERHYLNDQVRAMYEKMEEKIPGYDWRVLDKDISNKRIILNAFTDRNPGVIYYYDGDKNRLVKLTETNPKLKEHDMAVMRPISFDARDGVRIHGYLTMPNGSTRRNLPVIVYPHGGPSDRNIWGFSPEVQYFANRGYAVFQVNYRGSTGYGKRFWEAGFKEWGGKIQEDITDGVQWLIGEKIADPERIGIYGSGFGGYSALHAASFNSKLYACAASYGGFTNLFTHLKEIPPHLKPYLQMYYEIIGNPETESDLIKAMSPVFHADHIQIPVLIAQGGKDSRSTLTESNQLVEKLRKRKIPVTYIVREEEGRLFRKEENLISFYEELGRFFDEHLKK